MAELQALLEDLQAAGADPKILAPLNAVAQGFLHLQNEKAQKLSDIVKALSHQEANPHFPTHATIIADIQTYLAAGSQSLNRARENFIRATQSSPIPLEMKGPFEVRFPSAIQKFNAAVLPLVNQGRGADGSRTPG